MHKLLAVVLFCLTLGFASASHAKMGIPFGLFWGAGLEDLGRVCGMAGWKCRQKLFANAGQKLELIAEFTQNDRDYKASFLLEENRLTSINLLRYISSENVSQGIQDCARDFASFNGFTSIDNYELLNEENSNGSSMVNYLTAASRITVFYGPVAPGTTLMVFYWNPLPQTASEQQQNDLDDIERALDDLKQ